MYQRAICPNSPLAIMPKDIRGKVTLTPEAYKALEVEAMLMGLSLKDVASKMILENACPKCIEILGIMARPPKGQKEEGLKEIRDENPKGQMTLGTKELEEQRPEGNKIKRKRLIKDPEALARIKELWELDPRPSPTEIAKQINYSESTTRDAIKRMKTNGELLEKRVNAEA